MTSERRSTLPACTERVLMVDDEPLLLDANARILQREGYRVVTRDSGHSALAPFRLSPHEIDLVITDYRMPEMKGVELAREIFRIRPDVPVILLTSEFEISCEEAEQIGFGRLAHKPISRMEMMELVRTVLEDDSASQQKSQASSNLPSNGAGHQR